MIGEDKLIHFSGVEMGEACTIVLRGASKNLSTLLLSLGHDDFAIMAYMAKPLEIFALTSLQVCLRYYCCCCLHIIGCKPAICCLTLYEV